MTKWFIYLNKGVHPKTKEEYISREYYRRKVKTSDTLIFVGEAELSEEYFIINSETHFTDIISLEDIEVEYSATLKNKTVSTFKYTFSDLLIKAKEGLLPYLSFDGFKVSSKPKLIIKGKKHKVHSDKVIDYIN
jgi:hypothetical protein